METWKSKVETIRTFGHKAFPKQQSQKEKKVRAPQAAANDFTTLTRAQRGEEEVFLGREEMRDSAKKNPTYVRALGN